jgi:predicted nucleic acid-binding Zn ribbon protein
MAQEVISTCGVSNTLLPSNQEEVTLPEHAKTTIVHPCGSTGTVNLRVVVHFMLKSDGTGNFNEYNDGRVGDPYPGTDPDYHYKWNGYRFAAELIHAANTIMIPNNTLERTPFSTCSPLSFPRPAVFDKRILYTLQGVYFHRNTTSYNEYGLTATDTYHSTYAVKKDSCIQIYIFPKGTTGSSGYVHRIPADNNNVACFVKNYWEVYNNTANTWENIIWSNEKSMHKSLNHEIMYLLGLHHTDASPYGFLPYLDFCEDTPECYDKKGYNTLVNDSDGVTNCDICTTVLTPDQLERVYITLNGGSLWTSGISPKNYTNMVYFTKYRYQCQTCGPTVTSADGITQIPIGSPPYSFFHLNKNGCGQVFMGGGWYGTWFTFANQFIEIFETDMYGSNTVVGNYYSSWTTATSSSYLRNLSALYTFTPNKWYKVKMAVNSSCVGWHESSQWFLYTNPTPCERIAQINDTNIPTSQVYPNPVTDKANLTFVHPVQHIKVIDAMAKIADAFVAENPHFTVWQPDMNLPNGLYFIVSDNRQNSRIKVIVQR